ncbi:MAG: elongation factor Ts [Candidatus Paceibacterota bacterium]|jgi:elongation factor Ts
MITTEQIKQLRDDTGVSVMQCKKALEEAGGDMVKALAVLKKKSSDIATKKSDRALKAGVVAAYIHSNGTLGAMVELNCETDFVAKNEEFKALAYDIAMHVAAANPEFVKADDVPEEAKSKMIELFKEEVEKSGKPKEIQAKMLDGKVSTYLKERTLVDQPFIKNPDETIGDLVKKAVQKFGENTSIGKIARFSVLEK